MAWARHFPPSLVILFAPILHKIHKLMRWITVQLSEHQFRKPHAYLRLINSGGYLQLAKINPSAKILQALDLWLKEIILCCLLHILHVSSPNQKYCSRVLGLVLSMLEMSFRNWFSGQGPGLVFNIIHGISNCYRAHELHAACFMVLQGTESFLTVCFQKRLQLISTDCNNFKSFCCKHRLWAVA